MTELNPKFKRCIVCHENLIPSWASVCDECMKEYKSALEKEMGLYAIAEDEAAADVKDRKLRKYGMV